MLENTLADDDDNKNPNSDLLWGARAIGDEIGKSEGQVYYLLRIGALDGAVAKLGHKIIVGSRRALRNLPFKKSR